MYLWADFSVENKRPMGGCVVHPTQRDGQHIVGFGLFINKWNVWGKKRTMSAFKPVLPFLLIVKICLAENVL